MKRLRTWRTLSALVVTVAVSGCGNAPPSPPASSAPSSTSPSTSSGSPAPTVADGTPASSAAHWVAAGTLNVARASTHAVALNDGRVLTVGNDNICTPGGSWDASAEVFDPSATAWTVTESLNAPRTDFVAVTMPDGRVLVTAA